MERITNLSAPPVVGRSYLVPTIRWSIAGHVADWPVFLPLHNDARFFAFKDDHYHVDPRFVDARGWRALGFWYVNVARLAHLSEEERAFAAAQAQPVGAHRHGDFAHYPPQKATWRRRVCKRAHIPYQHGDKPAVRTMTEVYAGRKCSLARTGWICPHQHWPMGSVESDADGVITCPLHGLRIDAATGVVLGADCQRVAA